MADGVVSENWANREIQKREKRIAELEAALRQIASKMKGAHDGAHILTVQDILKRVLQNSTVSICRSPSKAERDAS